LFSCCNRKRFATAVRSITPAWNTKQT
jgi:hypothetical protein